MAAINFSSLPENIRFRVTYIRRFTSRPIYVNRLIGGGWKVQIINSAIPVGSHAYGAIEKNMIKNGWAMVVGKVAEKETVQ